MNKEDLERFKKILLEKRKKILESLIQDMTNKEGIDTNELPDEIDMASAEYLHYFNVRLRGREKNFLEKIEKALKKIEDGTYGICEECEEEISIKRLEARPETTLCIRCKELQEKKEKEIGK